MKRLNLHFLMILLGFFLIMTTSAHVFARTHKVVEHPKTYHKTVVKLPDNHARITVSGHPYYFCNGVFYKKAPQGYIVIKTPVGARVKTLPRGYKIVRVDGKKYYLHQGIYFEFDPVRHIYVVVGTPNTVFRVNYSYTHRIGLSDGSLYDGVFLGGDDTIVEMEINDEIWEIPVDDIEYISFASAQ